MAVDNLTVLLDNDDVVIIGPPTLVEVGVDFGPEGQRGSQVWAGNGTPTSVNPKPWGVDSNLLINDLYIDAGAGRTSGWLYQYNKSVGGTNGWFPLLQITPSQYDYFNITSFTDGVATVTIPLATIFRGQVLNPTPASGDFMITVSPEDTATYPCGPFSYVIANKQVSGSNLVFDIYATEATLGSPPDWDNSAGLKYLHINIIYILGSGL